MSPGSANFNQKKLLNALILIILVARIGFSLVKIPSKKQDDPYQSAALKIAKIIGKEPVYLTGPPEPKTDRVQFAGIHFISYERNEPTNLAFQTSFYLSGYPSGILKYTETSDKPGFYISREENIPSAKANPDSIRVFYCFNSRLNKQDQWYLLYKIQK